MKRVRIYLVAIIGLLTVVLTGIDGFDGVMKDYFLSIEEIQK